MLAAAPPHRGATASNRFTSLIETPTDSRGVDPRVPLVHTVGSINHEMNANTLASYATDIASTASKSLGLPGQCREYRI